MDGEWISASLTANPPTTNPFLRPALPTVDRLRKFWNPPPSLTAQEEHPSLCPKSQVRTGRDWRRDPGGTRRDSVAEVPIRRFPPSLPRRLRRERFLKTFTTPLMHNTLERESATNSGAFLAYLKQKRRERGVLG